MLINELTVGQLEANCFIVSDEKTKDAIIIDPGDDDEEIMDVVEKNNLKVKYIVCTHAHFDHVGAVADIKAKTGALICVHKDEVEVYKRAGDFAAFWGFRIKPLPEPDMLLNEGDVIAFGSLSLKVLHTPGHSPGGMCLYGEDVIFTGDTLFAGSVGRTDLPGGNISELKKSFSKLMSFPPDTRVYAGHGCSSTIGAEKTDNFFAYEIN